ncbi:MAG: DUF4870 domain-containing protein [Candidatus Cloacimonetes bacterium]|nr:DUF4870 domain-containing protein [Candidatus Cloacimonadota bacterium]
MESNQNQRTMALLAHLLGLFTGFIAPLILYLVLNDQPYAKEQAKEALNFQITVIIGLIVSFILTAILIGVLLLVVVLVLDTVFCILATIAASRGEDYRYPISIRIVK